MLDKNRIARSLIQKKMRKKRIEENIQAARIPLKTEQSNLLKGGLHTSQAAFSAIRRKTKHRNESNPENAAVHEMTEDGRASINTTSNIAGKLVQAQHRKQSAQRESAAHHTIAPNQQTNNQSDIMGGTPNSKQQQNQANPIISNSSASSNNLNSFSDLDIQGGRNAKVSKRAVPANSPHLDNHVIQSRAQQMMQQKQAVTMAKTASKKAGVTAKNAIYKTASKVVSTIQKSASTIGKRILAALVGAWPVAIIMLALIIILAIVLSPMGMFFSNNEDNPNQLANIVQEVEAEWQANLQQIKQQYEAQGYKSQVFYGVADGDDGVRVDNWRDCIALYVVYMDNGDISSMAFTDDDKQGIRDLFFAMNPIDVQITIEEIQTEVEDADDTDTETQTETVQCANIWIKNLRYVQMLDKYPLNDEQIDLVEFLLDYRHDSLWATLGISSHPDSEIPADLSDIIKNLPPGTKGSKIVELALSRLGDPYSMDLRGQGRYIDCSGLTQWAYNQVGVSIPSTAAEQARWCVENGKVIDKSTAQPGDLIFYTSDSPRVAGRFMKIGHVGIYTGNGMMVDASSSRGCVVYREVYGSPVIWARP